jgi:hypothetical protein
MIRSEEAATEIIGTSGYQLNLAMTETLACFVEKKAAVSNIWTRPYRGSGSSAGLLEAENGNPVPPKPRNWMLVEFGTTSQGAADSVLVDLKRKGACETVKWLGSWWS